MSVVRRSPIRTSRAERTQRSRQAQPAANDTHLARSSEDLADHPRVRHAEEIRDAVSVFGWPDTDDVASLRAALRAGFEPVGSVQLYRP